MRDHDDSAASELGTDEVLHLGICFGIHTVFFEHHAVSTVQGISPGEGPTCLLVGSSSMRNFPGLSMALARQKSCR